MQNCVVAVAGYKARQCAARLPLPYECGYLAAAAGMPANTGMAASRRQGPIRDDIRELVEAAGAVFHQSFTKKTTHLICYRAESEIYAKALLFKLEGQQLEIINHRWVEDCIRQWRRMPEDGEAYRRLGVEASAPAARAQCSSPLPPAPRVSRATAALSQVDFEERLEAEKRLRLDVEAQLEEEERSRRNLQARAQRPPPCATRRSEGAAPEAACSAPGSPGRSFWRRRSARGWSCRLSWWRRSAAARRCATGWKGAWL